MSVLREINGLSDEGGANRHVVPTIPIFFCEVLGCDERSSASAWCCPMRMRTDDLDLPLALAA